MMETPSPEWGPPAASKFSPSLVDVWSGSSRADQDIVVVDLFFQKISPKTDITERDRYVR
jgi:hypothetical protein